MNVRANETPLAEQSGALLDARRSGLPSNERIQPVSSVQGPVNSSFPEASLRVPVNDRRCAETVGEFWRTHFLWPLGLFALLFSVLATWDLDRILAHRFYFDPAASRWLGDAWWAREFLHDGGRWLPRIVGGGALIAWLLCVGQRWRLWRRHCLFVLAAITLSVGLVGGLKEITNVDCPWDLQEFGGDRPFAGLFEHRPDGLPRGRCFPGAHAAAGFSMLCFYFVWRDQSRRAARWALASAIILGVLFAFAQEARGAHFLSHDVTSAALVWFVQLGLYVGLLRPRIHAGS